MKKTFALVAMLLVPLSFVAAVCGSGTTRIENTGNEQTHGITVSGEGKVSGKPDLALITLGVSTLRPTVAEARESAASSLGAMIDAMKTNGVAEKDIQTAQLNISPEYDYSNANQQQLRGFRVNNTVIAKIRNIDKTSDVIDASVGAGGNDVTIQSISFTIDNPETLREQARQAAVEDAKKKAQTLAAASGVSVGQPITISETNGFQPPVAFDRSAAAGAPEAQTKVTPIQPGELDVVIDVSVTWEIK